MCTQTIPLPQIRRVSSADIRDEWKRMTNSQRRFSFDYKISETVSSKNKSVLKVLKTSSTKQLMNNSINKPTLSSGLKVKSSIERIASKVTNGMPVAGDHQTLLDASQILELVNKSQKDCNSSFGTNELILINRKRYELEKVLRQNCMSCIRNECLDHLIKAKALMKELREMYFEDNFKLNVIKSNKSDDKRKLKVLDTFIKSCSSRVNLCQEIDQRSSSWISLSTNANRLMDVTHIRPNDESLDLLLHKTIEKLKYSRICCIYLLRTIFEINIEIMTHFVDSLPFESISQTCLSINCFNKMFVCNEIKELDLINGMAVRQAKVTTNKFLYYIYNEIIKNFELINKNDNIHKIQTNGLESEEITSDYFSVSSNSTIFYRKNKSSNFESKFSKDFKIVFNILIQSNQRVLLKIIFGHQSKYGQNETRISGYRQKWQKTAEFSNENQQKMCRELDKQFWDIFWVEFENLVTSCLCFCESTSISVPISVLCNPSKAQVIHTLLKAYIGSEELLDEAIKSLEFSYLNLSLRLSLYNYSQNYTKLLNNMNKSILTIEKRKYENKMGTLLGLSLIDCINSLIEVKITFKESFKEYQLIFDNIITNMLNMFLAFIETKQSIELDHKFLEYFTLSILDTNNLIEIVANLDSKPINEMIKILNNLKENALIKSKEFIFTKSYDMISKSIPLKDYRKKICSSNSVWIETIIGIVLEPIADLLKDYSSFESNILLSNLIEELSKAFLKSVFKMNRIQLRFTHSGAVQFNKDVNALWDWMVNNNIQSTHSNSINKLKSLSFSLANRDIPISTTITRHNRINPEINSIQNNQNHNLEESEQRIGFRLFNCLSFAMCSNS